MQTFRCMKLARPAPVFEFAQQSGKLSRFVGDSAKAQALERRGIENTQAGKNVVILRASTGDERRMRPDSVSMFYDRIKLAHVSAGHHFVEDSDWRQRFDVLRIIFAFAEKGSEVFCFAYAFKEGSDASSLQDIRQRRGRSFVSIR